MKNNNNLRSQKINQLLGYTPKKLLVVNAVTILAIFIILLLILFFVNYPPGTVNTLWRHLLQRLFS